MRHELESGAWVDLRPVQDLKSRDRDVWDDAHDQAMGVSASLRNMEVEVSEVAFSPARMARMPRRALLCRLLTAWSYDPLPLPKWAGGIENEASFGELPLGDEDEIFALLEPYVAAIGKKPDPKGRPAATGTRSSNGSRATSRHGSRPASPTAESGTAST